MPLKTPNVPAPPLRQLKLNGPAYGWLLALSTLLTLAVIAHHPMADLHNPAQGLANLVALKAQDQWVHGGLIVMTLLFATGFSGFAWRLGIAHPLVMAGWLSYVTGSVFIMSAAIVDGFVIPDVAASGHIAAAQAFDLIAFCGILIQALTKLGFVLTALGAVFWGHALLHHKGGALWIGLLGIAVGGFSAIFIVTSAAGFNVDRLLAYMVGQTLWHMTVAFWLIRGLRPPDES